MIDKNRKLRIKTFAFCTDVNNIPENTYLIHMSHDIDHEFHGNYLPDNIYFAYDGLSIEV